MFLRAKIWVSDNLDSRQVVVLSDSTFDVALTINDFCHTNNIRFLSTQSRGVFGNIFVDFGTDFVIYDNNGEAPTSAMISAITQAHRHPRSPLYRAAPLLTPVPKESSHPASDRGGPSRTTPAW